jgi:hypothetical protein
MTAGGSVRVAKTKIKTGTVKTAVFQPDFNESAGLRVSGRLHQDGFAAE